MAQAKAQIVHESEAQRQHVRVQIPATAFVNDVQYNVKDLSAGGIRFEGVSKSHKKNQKITCDLTIPMESFNIQLSLPCVVEYYDSTKKELGCAFSELSEAQISLINMIIQSYMNGTIITEGDVLHVAGRNNFVKYRKDAQIETPKGAKAKRAFSLLVLFLSGLLGLFFILGNIYENVSVLKSYQGVVQAQIITARTNANGTFKSLIGEDVEQVQAGQPIAEITGLPMGSAIPNASSTIGPNLAPASLEPITTTIVSPCDCYIVHQFVGDGEFRALGESLYKLVPVDSRPWVTAKILPKDAQRLNLQDDVKIRIAGETSFIEGNVTNFNADEDEEQVIFVRVRPKTMLPMALIGRPAYTEFIVY